jgi:hypothetical protein
MRVSLNDLETELPVHSEGRTYGFIITGLPEGVTVQIQLKHGTEWFPHPDIDYTPQAGVIRGKIFLVVPEIRAKLSGAVTPNSVLMTVTEGTTATW